MKNQNLVAFLSGLTVGAIITLLIAPDSGKNTRHKICDRFHHGEEHLHNLVAQKVADLHAAEAAIEAAESQR